MNKLISLKVHVLLVGIMLLSSFANATELKAAGQLRQKLQQLKTFQATFSQKVVDIDETVLQQANGYIALQQPNKLYWELLEPNESLLLADGTTLWNVDPLLEQVVAYNQVAAIENNPLILLADPDSQKWQDFNIMVSGEEFTITPIDQEVTIQKLSLFFKDSELIALQTIDRQEQVSRLTFSDIKQNTRLSDSKFVFAMPEGYELDDQRTQ